jgi:two-component system LytT family response regulator
MPVEVTVETQSVAEGQFNVMVAPKLRAIIADDEPLSREKLRFLIEKENEVDIVAECTGVEDTVTAIRANHPDVLLLDIEMEGGNGFDVLRAIPNAELPIVIFTTAYDNYALQAFESQALDYLLKPFDQERLHRALERARSEVAKSARGAINENLVNLLAARRASAEKRLIIKSGGRVVFIQLDEIEFIEAAANYVRLFVTGKNAYLFRESIGRMADKLDPAQFIRIHRSYIVNISKIKELQPCNNGEFMVALRNGKELPCSRFYRHSLESLWKGTQ